MIQNIDISFNEGSTQIITEVVKTGKFDDGEVFSQTSREVVADPSKEVLEAIDALRTALGEKVAAQIEFRKRSVEEALATPVEEVIAP